MPAREILCTVTALIFRTPTVFTLRFRANRSFRYEAGQFLSVYIPLAKPGHPGFINKTARRAYSISSSPEDSQRNGYELCIKLVPNGVGSSYLANLRVGDTFKASAPYGDFQYRPEKEHHERRQVCFICTGTGIGPVKSMIDSLPFKTKFPDEVKLIFGATDSAEVIFPGYFTRQGIETVLAFSQRADLSLQKPESFQTNYSGRVTSYLKDPETLLDWHLTDFYLCGNGAMIQEASRILQGRGVNPRSIHKEAYFTPQSVRRPDVASVTL